MKTIDEIQAEVIDEFSFFDNWMDKYEPIIEMGKDLSGLDESLKIDDNIVRGCQSRVWLGAKQEEGKLLFSADSDAIITKGLVSLMVRVLSNHKAEEIANANLHFVDEIGLNQQLSPNRANGLASMIKKMKMYALAYQAKDAQ